MEHHALVYTVASVAGAALLYVLLDTSEPHKVRARRRPRSLHVHGLANRGNQCFANSVLQAFASCPSFMSTLSTCLHERQVMFDLSSRCRAWLIENSQKEIAKDTPLNRSVFSLLFGRRRLQHPFTFDLSGLNKCALSLNAISAAQAKLTKSMKHTLTALNGQDNSGRVILSAAVIMRALKFPEFCTSNEEQDAHELFNLVIASLEEENAQLRVFLPFDDYKQLAIDQVQDPLEEKIETNRLKFELPTKGSLANQLWCARCGNKSAVGIEKFHSVSLAIPEKVRSPVTLNHCLSQFVRTELLTNVNCDNCMKNEAEDYEKNSSTFVKRQTFASLPKLLCFHIQRLAWLPDGRLVKKNQVVQFPEKLVMDDFCFSFSKDSCKSALEKLRLVGGNSQYSTKPENPDMSTFTYIHGQEYDSGDTANRSNENELLTKKSGKHEYSLCAVVVHLGGAFNGHYVCYRKLQYEDKTQWFYVSDETVVPCNFQKVLSVPAYMLFYEKN